MSELKNCPFCDSEAMAEAKFLNGKGTVVIVRCEHCRACASEEVWNTRAPVKCVHQMAKEFLESFK